MIRRFRVLAGARTDPPGAGLSLQTLDIICAGGILTGDAQRKRSTEEVGKMKTSADPAPETHAEPGCAFFVSVIDGEAMVMTTSRRKREEAAV